MALLLGKKGPTSKTDSWLQAIAGKMSKKQVKPGFTTPSRNQSIFGPEVNEEAKKSLKSFRTFKKFKKVEKG